MGITKERPRGPKPDNPPPPRNPEAAREWRRLAENKRSVIEEIYSRINGEESLEEISNKIEKFLSHFKIFDYPLNEEDLWNEYWRKKGIDPKFMNAARKKLDKKEDETEAVESPKEGGPTQELDKLEKKIDDLEKKVNETGKLIFHDAKTGLSIRETKTSEKSFFIVNALPLIATLVFSVFGAGALISCGVESFWLRVAIMQIPIMFFWSWTKKLCGAMTWNELWEMMKFLFGVSFLIILFLAFVAVIFSTSFFTLPIFFIFFCFSFVLNEEKEYYDKDDYDCLYYKYKRR